jgi:hypothetical protein
MKELIRVLHAQLAVLIVHVHVPGTVADRPGAVRHAGARLCINDVLQTCKVISMNPAQMQK